MVQKISETNVKGSYPRDAIEQTKKNSLSTHKQLSGAQFIKAENIWANG